MNKKQEKNFFRILEELNKSQFEFMKGFVSQGKDRAKSDIKFQWEDKTLFDYVNLKFDNVKIYWRDINKLDDNTEKLVKPINDLIDDFNNRKIDYITFIEKYKTFSSDIKLIESSEKYSVHFDNFEVHYLEASSSSIKGVGGMGKSHFLWDCQIQIQEADLYKSLFLYGKYFDAVSTIPWDEIVEYSENKEFLLVVDGINEIVDINKRIIIYENIKKIQKTKFGRVFISYRTYSLNNKINEQNEEDYIDSLLKNTINFAGVDFDSSIMEIVANSKVDLSYFYHILFSNNPMQIRMLIEGDILNNPKLFKKFKNKSIVNITFIYERFVRASCDKIWKDKQMKEFYWSAIKDIAQKLYITNNTFFTKNDVTSKNIDINKFLNDLKNGGFVSSYDNKYFFKWEQLSNYLIARSFFMDIKSKGVDEVVKLFKKKSKEFPQIKQFLISSVVEKYENNFVEFIEFIKKAKPNISDETLLNISIKDPNDRIKLQNCLKYKDDGKILSNFCGIPNRVYNCESYLYDKICNVKPFELKPTSYFNKFEVVRKLKCNLNNINGKYFLLENANEFMKFAIICLLIPDNDIINLAEKTIYDLITLYDIDFTNLINNSITNINSPLIKRSIYNVVCHLSQNKIKNYLDILNDIHFNKKITNAKLLSNYCKFQKLKPFDYVTFKKVNLYKKYENKIDIVKEKFDEIKSLGGVISIIRMDKLYYSLKIELYHNLKLNFDLMDVRKTQILKFNNIANKYTQKYNNCDCNIEIWDNYFQDQISELKEKLNITYKLLNQENLFWCFICHLIETFKKFKISEDELKWYKENRYRQYKTAPDNITTILDICVEEFVGSLMCNYFNNTCAISYWEDNKIYLGYEPICYDEDQINLCSPIDTYNPIVSSLDELVIKRLNSFYKGSKDKKWADNDKSALKNIRGIVKPYTFENNDWVLLSAYINNRTYYPKNKGNKEYSEECIILNCATNYIKNKHYALDRYKTIEIKTYKGDIDNYKLSTTDFCYYLDSIANNSNNFNETNLAFPPTSIINELELMYDRKSSSWITVSGEIVILCNNGKYSRYIDEIGHSVYIKKSFYDKIKDKLNIYYYVYTERLSYETGYFSSLSDMHVILKNNRIIKTESNSGKRHEGIKLKLKRECKTCPVYLNYLKDLNKYENNDVLSKFIEFYTTSEN